MPLHVHVHTHIHTHTQIQSMNIAINWLLIGQWNTHKSVLNSTSSERWLLSLDTQVDNVLSVRVFWGLIHKWDIFIKPHLSGLRDLCGKGAKVKKESQVVDLSKETMSSRHNWTDRLPYTYELKEIIMALTRTNYTFPSKKKWRSI